MAVSLLYVQGYKLTSTHRKTELQPLNFLQTGKHSISHTSPMPVKEYDNTVTPRVFANKYFTQSQSPYLPYKTTSFQLYNTQPKSSFDVKTPSKVVIQQSPKSKNELSNGVFNISKFVSQYISYIYSLILNFVRTIVQVLSRVLVGKGKTPSTQSAVTPLNDSDGKLAVKSSKTLTSIGYYYIHITELFGYFQYTSGEC